MSWALYMNMDVLAIEISKEHIELMTDDNFEEGDDVYLDEKVFLNNIKNGFIVITQLNCFIECFLNAILNFCIGYNEEALLKCNHQEKLDIIFLYYSKDLSSIKNQNCWASYKKTTRVRNEMIHFKRKYIGHSGSFANFELGNTMVGNFFTKAYMKKMFDDHMMLAKEIAKVLDLVICDDVGIFTNQGTGEEIDYVRPMDRKRHK